MEQIKPVVEFLKKHGFWIITGIVLLVTLFTYRSISNGIEAKRIDSEKKVISSYNQVKAIMNEGDDLPSGTYHPNEATHVGMEELALAAKREVREAWELKYKDQKEFLVWDAEIGEKSIAKFKALELPIEKSLEFTKEVLPQEDFKVDQKSRVAYQVLMRYALPGLAEKIGEGWQPILDRTGNSPRLKAEKEKVKKSKRVVVWNKDNQLYWEDKFTNFTNDINEYSYPRIIQVMYAQEDKWILQSILEDIIKKTNGDANANDLAKIKKIDHIYIGTDAQGIVGEVERAKDPLEENKSDGGGGGEEDGMAAMMAAAAAEMAAMKGAESGMPTSDSGTGTAVKKKYGDGTEDPANGRYVDLNYEPLSAKALREAYTKVTKDSAYLVIAKRVPVRIGLGMDETALMDLLANCANARFPLEVRQVRINAHEPLVKGSLATQFKSASGGTATTGAKRGGRGGEERGEGGEDAMAMMMAAQSEGEGEGGMAVKEEVVTLGGAYDTKIEIFGIIYLYNPPDESLLDIPDDEAGAEPATPTEPEEPTAGVESEAITGRS